MTESEAYRVLAAWRTGDNSVRDLLDHALAAAPAGTTISTDGNGRRAWSKRVGGWGPQYGGEIAAGKLFTLPLGTPVWSLLHLHMGTAPAPEKFSDNQRTVSFYERALVVVAAMRPNDTRSFGATPGSFHDVIVRAEDCSPYLYYRVHGGFLISGALCEDVHIAATTIAEILNLIAVKKGAT